MSKTLWIVLQWGGRTNGLPVPLSAHFSREEAERIAADIPRFPDLSVTIAETVPQKTLDLLGSLQSRYERAHAGREALK